MQVYFRSVSSACLVPLQIFEESDDVDAHFFKALERSEKRTNSYLGAVSDGRPNAVFVFVEVNSGSLN